MILHYNDSNLLNMVALLIVILKNVLNAFLI